jgi:hypothetical protein
MNIDFKIKIVNGHLMDYLNHPTSSEQKVREQCIRQQRCQIQSTSKELLESFTSGMIFIWILILDFRLPVRFFNHFKNTHLPKLELSPTLFH